MPGLRQSHAGSRSRSAPEREELQRFLQWLQRVFPLKQQPLILGIESSCDDTSVALLRGPRHVLSWRLSSQIERHLPFGGVVPEYASRMHLEAIIPLLREVLAEGGVTDPVSQLDAIAVTKGPGLMGALLVGLMTAKALAQVWKVPLVGVNHLEGHICANLVSCPDLDFPFLCAVVSGGHTEIVLARSAGCYELIGQTRDDAAGEAFDKVAKALGLGYPGGPVVDRLAKQGNAEAFRFPIPLGVDSKDFSFSGLKTAVLSTINSMKMKGCEVPVADICASFQRTVVTTLVSHLEQAVCETGVTDVALSGGVAANSELRDAVAGNNVWRAFVPERAYCTDNAVMIASAGCLAFQRGCIDSLSLGASPSLPLFD